MKLISRYLFKVRFKLLVEFYNAIKYTVLPFKSRRILIVKLDAIGDYVLFRNMIAFIHQSQAYKGYKLSLLGNVAFKDLAEHFDSHLIEKFYWIDPGQLYAFPKNLSTVLKIKLMAFDILINPVHSSTEEVDSFIGELGAKHKIGSTGDTVNIVERAITARSDYDELLNVPGTDSFEFYRNRAFIAKLTGEECLQKLELPFKRLKEDRICIIVFPGASQAYRRWSTENFAAVINSLNEVFKEKLRFEICGSATDKNLAEEILSQVADGENVTDTTGKTKLIGLVDTIGNCDLLISNETVAVHIGAAVATEVICISNGNHFGRFNPYPTDISSKVTTIYPLDAMHDESLFAGFSDKFKVKSELDINLIKPAEVAKIAIGLIENRLAIIN